MRRLRSRRVRFLLLAGLAIATQAGFGAFIISRLFEIFNYQDGDIIYNDTGDLQLGDGEGEHDPNWMLMPRRNTSLNITKIMKEIMLQNRPFSIPFAKVLVVGYYRGGSSFIGKLFDVYPDPESRDPPVFYWYEPLGSLYKKFYKTSERSLIYHGYNVKGEKKNATVLDLEKQALKIIDYIYTCNITGLHMEYKAGLLHPFLTRLPFASRILKYYTSCTNKLSPKTLETNLSQCLEGLEHACVNAKSRSIKTIRMSLKMASQLRQKHPDLWIIYGFRDPRAIISSILSHEAAKYEGSPNLLKMEIVHLCERMRQDIKQMKQLKVTNIMTIDRFAAVKFEQLSLMPAMTTGRLYQAMNWTFTYSMRTWIRNTTSADPEQKSSFDNPSVVQRNSSRVVQMWQKKLPPHVQKLVIKECRDVLVQSRYDLKIYS